MIKSLSKFLSIGLLSLVLTSGAQAQPTAGDDGPVTSQSEAQRADDNDEGLDMGWLGLLGLLGLAGLIPLKHRNPDRENVQRRSLSATETRK